MDIHSAIKFGTKSNVKTPQEALDRPAQTPPPKQESREVKQVVEEQVSTPSSPPVIPVPPPVQTAHQAPTPPPPTLQMIDEVPAPLVFKAVDLNIAGTNHRINCPADEVSQLEKAGEFINDKIREIRHETKGKNLSNEELLVLICLELYDSQESLRVERRNQLSDNERARALIEKINENARSVL